jgi:hypothetical protein
MSMTNAHDTNIHAVSPVSNLILQPEVSAALTQPHTTPRCRRYKVEGSDRMFPKHFVMFTAWLHLSQRQINKSAGRRRL